MDRPLAVLGKIKGVLMEDSAVFEEVLESLEVILNDVHHVMKLKSRGRGPGRRISWSLNEEKLTRILFFQDFPNVLKKVTEHLEVESRCSTSL